MFKKTENVNKHLIAFINRAKSVPALRITIDPSLLQKVTSAFGFSLDNIDSFNKVPRFYFYCKV